MKFRMFLLPLLGLLAACSSSPKADNLTTEYLRDPLGIDARTPRLSWQIESPRRGTLQETYEIRVWTGPENPARGEMVWESGQVASGQSLHVAYAGKPLQSNERYYWQVRVHDNHGKSSAWSRTALWQTGLLDSADWKGQWIGLDQQYSEPEDDRRRLSARMLRREFTLDKPVARATVYLSGLGFSELYLNGAKVGDRVMDPTHSNYDRRYFYVAHDVTAQLHKGANALGVWLGNGRFFAPRVRIPAPTPTFGFPKMLLQMEIEYTDGSRETLVSDASWKVTDQGPIRANNEFDGEEYDARMEQPGWDAPGFDDSAWQPAMLVAAPKGTPVAQMQEPMRVLETLAPVEIRRQEDGKYWVDFGQNLYGMCRIRVSGPRDTRVVIRAAFDLDSSGKVDLSNNRSALCTDVYTLKGEGTETWAPRFRGQGFRYAEIEGWPGELTKENIGMLAVQSDLQPVGTFACSNELVNRIYANMWRTVRMQERGLPMDPDRDERQAWLSVSEMSSETEGYMYNVAAFYENFLSETRADQRADGCLADGGSLWAWSYSGDPCWPSVITTNPWSQYRMYGDDRQIELCYPVMKKWVEYLGTLVDQDLIFRKGCYSDWVDASTMDIYDRPPFGDTPKALLSTAYYYYNLKVVERTALFLGRPLDEVAAFGDLAEHVKEAYNNAFFDAATGRYLGDTQAGYALAFEFDLVPEGMEQRVATRFADRVAIDDKGHLTVGCPGTKWLMQALTRIGRTDLAYTILTQTTRPSWGYMVAQGGTSIWERWDCNTQEPGMNGQSQTILSGYLGAWMYRTLGGIAYDPEEPGFRHIIMRPEPAGDLSWVDCSFESLYGEIVSNWKIVDGKFHWSIRIPAGCRATIFLPTDDAHSVQEGRSETEGVHFQGSEPGVAVFALGSGEYNFTADYKK